MAITLVLETGSGADPTANSYASVAEADAYFEASQFSATWTALTDDQKSVLLISATRQIDALYSFNGGLVRTDQPLQWPRAEAINPDSQQHGWPYQYRALDIGVYFDWTKVPKLIKTATFEQAKAMQPGDRTGDQEGQGISRVSIFQGIDVSFNGKSPKPMLSSYVQTLLTKVGRYKQSGGVAKLVRT